MAAFKLKLDKASVSETEKNENLQCYDVPQGYYQDCNKYKGLDTIFYVITIAIFTATVVTDLCVVIEHWLNTYKLWAYCTIGLALVPSCFIQILSLKWYQTSGELKGSQWIFHIFHFAIIYRFYILLYSAMKSQISLQQKDWIFKVENDAFILNLFTSLLVSVPQIILQIYVMAILQHMSFWTSASVIASLCSLTWALTAYALLINRTNHDKSQFTWSSIMIQGFWRGGMLISRIAALVLAVICFKAWILVIFGVHALGMSMWIIQQATNFCLTAVEEFAYKCLIGAVYFFDFLRLTDNQVRYHVCVFYSVMIVQNAIFYAVYLVFFKDLFQTNVLTISTVMILGGIFVGAISMLIHFCMFQNVKTIKLCMGIHVNPEISSKENLYMSISKSSNKKWNNVAVIKEIKKNITTDITADKKCVLTNIVQNTESIEKGIINTCFMNSDETNVIVQVVVEDSKITNIDVAIENLHNQAAIEKKFEREFSIDLSTKTVEQIKSSCTNSLHHRKCRGICSEIELDSKQNEVCDFNSHSQLCSQKRRGICSSTQLGLELVTNEDNYVEKSFSSLDKLKSNSEVYLNIEDKSIETIILDLLPIKSFINNDNCSLTIPENIFVRGRLNAPVISESSEMVIMNQLFEKDQDLHKSEEETMSFVTSIHDYENLCPIGVARPPWCIRSWRGYTDIETYIHDDSIVRDRRRDTLTSTATATTLSSDFSDTYAGLPLRKFIRRSRQDDYLDTLIYDLVDWESMSSRPSTEEIFMAMTSTTATADTIHDVQEHANLFSAKPIVIDEKGGMLALDTILEEREDCGNFSELYMSLKKPGACSVSSLVATIDEIRKCTAENSPRHVYHRTESHWEDLEQKILMKRAHLTKVLFANDYSNVTLSYNDPWSSSFISDRNNGKLSIIKEMKNFYLNESNGKTPLINAILSDSPILGSKTDTQACEDDDVYVNMNSLDIQKCRIVNHKGIEPLFTDIDILSPGNSTLMKSKDNSASEKVDGYVRKKVEFVLTKNILNDTFEAISEKPDFLSTKNMNDSKIMLFNIDKNQIATNQSRQKISLIRERFEPQSNEQIVCVMSPAWQNKIMSSKLQFSSLNKRISVIFNDADAFDSPLSYHKQNFTMKAASVLEDKNEVS